MDNVMKTSGISTDTEISENRKHVSFSLERHLPRMKLKRSCHAHLIAHLSAIVFSSHGHQESGITLFDQVSLHHHKNKII